MRLLERINRILLIVRCIIRGIFYGVANRVPKNISTVMVVPTGKLGDVVCATPVLHAIRTYLPKVRIIVAGNTKLHRALLSNSGLVDDYIDLEENGAVARIKEYNAGAALVTGPSFTTTALMYLSGIPLVVAARVEGGFSPSETRPYKILKKFITTFPYRMGEYAPRERLKVLESLNIFTEDTTKHLAFSSEANNKAQELFGQYKDRILIGISPSAGNKIKEWPVDRFAEVANYIALKYNAVIVIVGGQNDTKYSEKMRSGLNKEIQYIDTTGTLSIDELKATISKLNLFVSVDTGPIYIAEAFNVPTVDIVGPMDEREQPPIGKLHKIVVTPRKKPELHILNARMYNKKEARRQTLSVSTQDVIDEIDGLIDVI